MKKIPRHQEISRELLAEIAGGMHDVSGKLPSEAVLMQRFEVSRPTVARALLDLKIQGVLSSRAGSGTYLTKGKDVPSLPHQLGMIVPGLGGIEIFDIICGELASLARVHELGMQWGGSTRRRSEVSMSVEEAVELCDRYVEMRVNGVFFAPFETTRDNEAANRSITQRLSHAGIPLVLLDRDIHSFPRRSGFDLVGIDNFAAGYLLAEHLIKLGLKRIAFVAKSSPPSTVQARKAGAISAMMAHGIAVPPDFFRAGDCTDVKFARSLTAGREVEAVICSNDHTAAQLLQTFSRQGIRVPQDLRVVGVDDVRFATLLSVPLTTIQQPCQEIAVTAFRAMRERIADPMIPPRSLLLTPRLVVRESCGAYLKR